MNSSKNIKPSKQAKIDDFNNKITTAKDVLLSAEISSDDKEMLLMDLDEMNSFITKYYKEKK